MLNYGLIGKRIAETRKLRKISQLELAELADLSPVYISNIENAKKKASLQSLVSIADVMQISVDMLLSGNQANGLVEYHSDIFLLMEDCSDYENRIIIEQIIALKTSLRNNRYLLNTEEDFYISERRGLGYKR